MDTRKYIRIFLRVLLGLVILALGIAIVMTDDANNKPDDAELNDIPTSVFGDIKDYKRVEINHDGCTYLMVIETVGGQFTVVHKGNCKNH